MTNTVQTPTVTAKENKAIGPALGPDAEPASQDPTLVEVTLAHHWNQRLPDGQVISHLPGTVVQVTRAAAGSLDDAGFVARKV